MRPARLSLKVSFCLLGFAAAGPRAADDVVITELMASNDSALADNDGDFSDWIELYNAGAAPVNLAGWYLTDDPTDLSKWQFPAVTIPANGFRLVFASNKDRRDPAAPLHTNFELLSSGEYLAVVKPDGVTVAHAYAPAFPPQTENFSYGLAQDSTLTHLVASSAASKTLIPPDGSLGLTWTQVGFNDAGWISGQTGVGYDRNPDYLSLINTDVKAQMDNLRTSAYVRIPFTLTTPAGLTGLFLRMKYDDGFAAYLNGTAVVSRNAPATPAWDSVASADHNDSAAVIFEEYDISSSIGLLRAGQNVLAIHGLNTSLQSSDFLVLPELDAFAAGTLDRGTKLYFDRPSPGLGNLPGYAGIAEKPAFSRPSGLVSASFSLTITSATPGASVRYTLDRSDPTASSTLYTGPVNIAGTTMVRARAFAASLAASPTVTQSYLMLGANVRTFSSNLPLIVVETFGQGINDSFWTQGYAAIMDVGAGGRSSIAALPDFTGNAGIKTRGSSSLGFPKHSYNFEVRDERGNDLDVPLLGFPAESDWILYGPYTDKTLMRDQLSYLWSNRVGRWAVGTKFVEMYVNTNGGNVDSTDYVGVYMFAEKIKRGEDRVDIHKLDASAAAEPEITGGYILKKDRLDPGDTGMATSQGHVLGFVYPKEQYVTGAQRAWIKGYLDAFEAALYGASFKDPVNGYRKYIDVDSFIDHHILVEITKNIDGYRLSTFMYKDRGGKLNMGPIWDYNLCLGNANYLQGWVPTGWYYSQLGAGDYPWYGRLFQDADFAQRYIDRWTALRRGVFQTGTLVGDMGDSAALLGESQVRNYQTWPILGTYVWPNWYIGATYQDEMQFMTNWLQDRVVWWDGRYTQPPVFNRAGGPISPGFSLTMSAPAGTIYYTLDGADPRSPGGSKLAAAITYAGPVALDANTRVFARAKTGAGTTGWSGATDYTFVVTTPPLVITEIMYHPLETVASSTYSADDYEFLEVMNTGSVPLDLAGFQLRDAVSFTFPATFLSPPGAAATLPPGGYAVVVKSLAAFTLRYGTAGINIAGEFDGNLSNAGEHLTLAGPLNEPILDFSYSDDWYPPTDGLDASLVIVNPRGALSSWGDKASWRESLIGGGSPGTEDSGVTGGLQLPGDSNQDGVLDLSDAVSLLLRLFGGLARPTPCDGGGPLTAGGNKELLDLNGDGSVNVSDPLYALNFLFRGGSAPAKGLGCVRIDGCPDLCR